MIPSMENTVVYSPFDLEDFLTVRSLRFFLPWTIKKAVPIDIDLCMFEFGETFPISEM